MEHEPVAGHAGSQRELELAECGDVRAHSLGGEQAEQGDVRECLRPVDDERVTFHARVRARTRKNGVTAIDNERRPEVTRECGRTHAADDELAVVDGGRVGKQLDQGVISRPTSPA